MQYTILNLSGETPDTEVTLTGSAKIGLQSPSKIKRCQQLLLRRLSINNQITGISFDIYITSKLGRKEAFQLKNCFQSVKK